MQCFVLSCILECQFGSVYCWWKLWMFIHPRHVKEMENSLLECHPQRLCEQKSLFIFYCHYGLDIRDKIVHVFEKYLQIIESWVKSSWDSFLVSHGWTLHLKARNEVDRERFAVPGTAMHLRFQIWWEQTCYWCEKSDLRVKVEESILLTSGTWHYL